MAKNLYTFRFVFIYNGFQIIDQRIYQNIYLKYFPKIFHYEEKTIYN